MRPTSVVTPPDTGRMCFRYPGEPVDERPLIKIRDIWDECPEQQPIYEAAVRDNPRIVDIEARTIESPLAYIQRIAEIVASKPLPPPSKRIPPRHRMNREYTGPRESVKQDGLSFEDRTDLIYTREPGEEG